VQEIRPDTILLRMPGFGLDGPWRDNPAFAYVIEAASGVSWLTGYPDRNPYEPYSIGDPNAGIHAVNALLLALEFRRTTGRGVMIEAAMIDAALNIAPNKSSNTPHTGLCCNGQAIGDRRRHPKTSTAQSMSTNSAASTAGLPSPSPMTSSGPGSAARLTGRRGRSTKSCRPPMADENGMTSSTST
jgi:crotonobetainyl-CoA:carnitine CoA-transferase CaiB-like acyl-CoA transferase